MARFTRANEKRCGLTLVELLVVVTVLVILVAISLPLIQPSLQGRETREAARQVNSFLASAQARAMTLGRPVGVIFHRRGTESQKWSSFQLSLAHVPPPYAGDNIDSRAVIRPFGGGRVWTVELTKSWTSGSLPDFILPGDLIKFDYRGDLFEIVQVNQGASGATLQIGRRSDVAASSSQPPLTPSGGIGVPFQIFRRPQKLPGSPLELTTPAIVDLWWSGMGSSGFREFVPLADSAVATEKDDPVIITFSPSGRVDRIFHGGISRPALAPIHLLIGRVDHQLEDQIKNLRDANNLWVTIAHRTGQITTSNNNGLPQLTGQDVAIARDYARQSQNVGGR